MNVRLKQDLKETASRIEQRLLEIFSTPSRISQFDLFQTQLHTPPVLLEQVQQLTMRGGKRLRAAFVLWGGALFDESALHSRAHLDTAAAMELMQTYLLIHDDIMDNDTVRRGGPTVHAALEQAGMPPSEAIGLAILAGDLAQALFDLVISNLDVAPQIHQALRQVLSGMHLDVIHGQTLDVTRLGKAETVAQHKTASYTTTGPLVAGAVLTGQGKPGLQQLASLALPLGIAFQLQDDLLGLFGDPDKTGKPRATDLKQGKHNWLIEKCLESKNAQDTSAITAVFNQTDADETLVDAALETIEHSGVKTLAQRRISNLCGQFEKGIKAMEARKEAKIFLCDLAAFIGSREL